MKNLFIALTLLVSSITLKIQNVGVGTPTPDNAKFEVNGAITRTQATMYLFISRKLNGKFF